MSAIVAIGAVRHGLPRLQAPALRVGRPPMSRTVYCTICHETIDVVRQDWRATPDGIAHRFCRDEAEASS